MAALIAVWSAWPVAPASGEQSSSRSRSFFSGRIDSSYSHSCAIAADGTLRCWGEGAVGELGYGNKENVGDNESPASAGVVNPGGHSAVSVSVGGSHSCAILDDRTLRCWGSGSNGQLGYGNTTAIGDNETPGSVGPVSLGAGRSATAVSVGGNHTCAILDNGTVRCWGLGTSGQLGYGNTLSIGDNETPGSVGTVDLGVGRTAVAISTGAFDTCALLDNGTVRCWGSGASGQLGYGNTTTIGDTETPGSVGPVSLPRNAIAIASGNTHNCALLDNGTVRCWGLNSSGQLGYGNTTPIGDNETPAAGGVNDVDLGSGRKAVALAGGTQHTCAILDNGTMRCWGLGTSGQLGYGNTTTIGDTEAPAAAGPVDLGVGRTALTVSTGENFSCAQLDNRTVRCWGTSAKGQLGYGNTTVIGDTETPAAAGPIDFGVPLVGRYPTAISGSGSHTCAILDNGTVRCWGHPSEGQLGYGNLTTIGDNETPGSIGPVDLGSGRTATAIAAGDSHTCALLDNGTVRCWGSGNKGQLGYGNTADIGDNEAPSAAGPVELGRNAVAITAGGEFSCAILDDGSVRCWGEANFGQLGYGNTNNIGDNELPSSAGAVDLGLGRTAIAIDSGGNHTCAMLDNGTLRCWGQAVNGQVGYGKNGAIGDNELPTSISPIDVGSGRTAIAITAGGSHTCARLDNGTVRCWGAGGFGALGYGNTSSIGETELPSAAGPVDLGGHNASAVSADSSHTCAIHEDGTLRCWGYGEWGELGYAETETIGDTEPASSVGTVDLGESRFAMSVTGGTTHTCSLLDNGTVRCWGNAQSGVLGYGNNIDIGDDEFPSAAGPVDFFDDSPTAVNDSKTVDEDAGATSLDVLTNDLDPDGGLAKSITAVTQPSNGAVAITGGGTGLTYQPSANYCNNPPGTTPDTFTYTLGGGSKATVLVTVTCVDDAPVAVSDSKTVNEDAAATALDVFANDADIDAGPKTVNSVTQPTNGVVAITGGGTGLIYQPNANYCNEPPGASPDTFTYTLNGGSKATVSVTVVCIDDGPVAIADSKTLIEDDPATAIDVLANDTDIDGGPKIVTGKTDPVNGTVVITGGGTGLTYQPSANYCNNPPGTTPDAFTYTLNGGSTATVSVTVSCTDDPPVAVDDSETLAEDSSATAINVLTNDTDVDGGPKAISSKTNGSNGVVSITGGGADLTYAPNPDYCGPDTFTYTLNGGSTATVSIAVTCSDDLPSAVNDSAAVAEDSGATAIDVLANDPDFDAGPKSIASVTQPANGAVAITGGGTGLTYQPNPNYCNEPPGGAPDTFTYTLNGGSKATVSATVTCVDDSVLAVDDSKTLIEDDPATAIDVLANDTDVDGGPKTVVSRTNGANGSVTITGGGAGLTYAPDANACGPDSFTYTLNGGSVGTVSITVTCVDDSPVAVNDSKSLNEDDPATPIDVLANDTDVDGGSKTITSRTNGSHGSVSITGGGTGLSYLPESDYCGSDSFTYTLNGGSEATVSIAITCLDDVPKAVDDSASLNEDASATAIDVLANDTDVDSGSKSIDSKTDGAHGAVALSGGGSGLTYKPSANYCNEPGAEPADTFTYTLSGGSTATVAVTVICVDDSPLAVNDSDTVLEDSGATAIDVLANDTDIDTGPKTITGRTNGSNGTVAIIGGGAGLTYSPTADYCGPDAFTYALNGGSQATVSINVTCVDEPPPSGEVPGGPTTPTTTTIIQGADAPTGPVVNVTPGVGVVSGRRHPRIAIKGVYAFFTLTCKFKDKDCIGTVAITASIPSVTLGPTIDKVPLVRGKFRLGASRSILVRARLTKQGRGLMESKRSLRGIGARMVIVDSANGEKGEIDVNLVRRPKASLLPGNG